MKAWQWIPHTCGTRIAEKLYGWEAKKLIAAKKEIIETLESRHTCQDHLWVHPKTAYEGESESPKQYSHVSFHHHWVPGDASSQLVYWHSPEDPCQRLCSLWLPSSQPLAYGLVVLDLLNSVYCFLHCQGPNQVILLCHISLQATKKFKHSLAHNSKKQASKHAAAAARTSTWDDQIGELQMISNKP
jgi:hypothetical protein